MKLTRERRLVLLFVILVGTFAVRATLNGRRPASAPAGAAVTSATIASAKRSAPETLRLGRLTLTGCDVGKVQLVGTVRAFCAQVRVPEDWSQPQGRQIALRVAVVPSRGARVADDLLVFLDGGPGGAAVDDYPGVAAAFAELRAHRHVLLLDQRGTGGSNELRCDDGSAGEAGTDVGTADQRQREAAQRAAIDRNQFDAAGLQQGLRDCLKKLAPRADPAQYTTGNAVRDLEAVRQALGAPRLDLIGVSYGTRMAQQYAAAHPEAVRSVILDSVVPNELALGGETAANLDEALKARFAVCVRTPACAQRFGDPYASLYRLRDALRAQPQKVTLRDPVTFAGQEAEARAADLAVTARLFAYSAATAALLPLTIDEALHGYYTPLLGQRKLITQAVNEQLTDGMGLSVVCAEDADLLQPRPQDDRLLLGQSMLQYLRAACEVWPKGARGADFHRPWRSAVPTLVLAGEFDPITPRRYGEAVVKNLANGRLLVLKGQGHGVLGSGCMPRLTGEFVDTLAVRTLDAACLDLLGDIPAFLGYNGAAP